MIGAEYQQLYAEHAELKKTTDQVAKELILLEKEEVQMQEKLKHAATKQKKLTKSITEDGHARSEAKTSFNSYGDDMTKLKAELDKHEANLVKEEAELEKICESLKGKTAGITQQIDAKQAELQPWLDSVAAKKGEVDIKTNERDLIKQKSEAAQRGLKEAQETLEAAEASTAESAEQITQLAAEKKTLQQEITAAKSELEVGFGTQDCPGVAEGDGAVFASSRSEAKGVFLCCPGESGRRQAKSAGQPVERRCSVRSDQAEGAGPSRWLPRRPSMRGKRL